MLGSGTINDPYIVVTFADLQTLGNYANAYFQLGADIDCSGWASGKQLVPVGTSPDDLAHYRLDCLGYKLYNIDRVNGFSIISVFGDVGEDFKLDRAYPEGSLTSQDLVSGLVYNMAEDAQVNNCLVKMNLESVESVQYAVGIGHDQTQTANINDSLFIGILKSDEGVYISEASQGENIYGAVDAIGDDTGLQGLIDSDKGLTDEQLKVATLPAWCDPDIWTARRNPVTGVLDYIELRCPLDKTLTISTGTGGTLGVLPSGSWLYRGSGSLTEYTPDVVTISAVADDGYTFKEWIGSGAGKVADVTAATTSITMDDDYEIEATFEVTPIYTPAEILRAYLLTLADFSDSDALPIYISSTPEQPDDCITIYDTAGVIHGKLMNGVTVERYGVSIRIRHREYNAGYVQALEVTEALSDLHDTDVVMTGGVTYTIQNASKTSPIASLGVEQGSSKRRDLFTVNYLLTVKGY